MSKTAAKKLLLLYSLRCSFKIKLLIFDILIFRWTLEFSLLKTKVPLYFSIQHIIHQMHVLKLENIPNTFKSDPPGTMRQ